MFINMDVVKYIGVSMIICKECGEKNPEDAKFCEICGKHLKKEAKTYNETNLIPCKECNKPISKNAELCPNCGIRLKKMKHAPDYAITRGITTRKSLGLAAVLGLFFGPFGYLYVRRYGLFIFWLIVGSILSVITGGIAAIILWIIWAIHQYSIAKRINEELGF